MHCHLVVLYQTLTLLSAFQAAIYLEPHSMKPVAISVAYHELDSYHLTIVKDPSYGPCFNNKKSSHFNFIIDEDIKIQTTDDFKRKNHNKHHTTKQPLHKLHRIVPKQQNKKFRPDTLRVKMHRRKIAEAIKNNQHNHTTNKKHMDNMTEL